MKKVSENIMMNRYGFLEKKEHPWQIKLIEDKLYEETVEAIKKRRELEK